MTNGISILAHTQPVYGEAPLQALAERVAGALGPAVVVAHHRVRRADAGGPGRPTSSTR